MSISSVAKAIVRPPLFEQRAYRLQGTVETNWLVLKVLASLFVWATVETVIFVLRRSA